ncbi:MAG: hypothetical protein Q4G35_08980 [Propionibacteriaceae bacterium]|nr:hypothetical protein [Propionibacteriaceae bacterium]
MTAYAFPEIHQRPQAEDKTVYLVASGDLRQQTNLTGWPKQVEVEEKFAKALEAQGWSLKRAHEYDEQKKHGFIDSQRMGMDVFANIPVDAPLVVLETVWQYSHHLLAGLRDHQGPILIAANFEGDFPGLVGILNLMASCTKAGIPYSALWSVDFTDDWFNEKFVEWLNTGNVKHDTSHVRDLPALPDSDEKALGEALAAQLQADKAILGIFDEGCMGMYNAFFDDEYLNPMGIYKERLSQSALVAEMRTVTDDEANAVRAWMDERGFTFHTGTDEKSELTDNQLREQFKMYIAAVRIAVDYGADAIGIQYQQGLKDMAPASDLIEGILNNVERPPVMSRDGSEELFAGKAVPHFNEVDEGVAVDALVTNRVWTAMGLDPATTLHDVRWGEEYDGQFVWVMMISGAVPASHLGGYQNGYSMRQTPHFFPLGGGTLAGICKPGELVWSRVYQQDDKIHADLGRMTSVELPAEETQRRLNATDANWPILHAVLHGVSRDQMMAHHKSNHLNVAYAPDAETADKALVAKAAMFQAMGIEVHLAGDVNI